MISAQYVSDQTARALQEDVATGDITARLIEENAQASARIITREDGVLCGMAFVNETFRQVDSRCQLTWQASDGDAIAADSLLLSLIHISEPTRPL